MSVRNALVLAVVSSAIGLSASCKEEETDPGSSGDSDTDADADADADADSDADSDSDAVTPLSPDEVHYDHSYGAWGAAYWTWAFEQKVSENAVLDLTGEQCDTNQEGPVWFL